MTRIIIGVMCGVLFISWLVGGLASTKSGTSLAPVVRAQADDQPSVAARPNQFGRRLYCSNLQGRYAANLQGFVVAGSAVLPFAGISVSNYDGFGNLTVVDLVSVNGNISPTTPFRNSTGTYTVNDDCTGTGSFTPVGGGPALNFKFVITDGGRELYILPTNPGSGITGIAKRLEP